MISFNVGILDQVYYRLMEKELDPIHTKHLSLTCQRLYSRWQQAPSDIWKSICERIFPQIFMPSQSEDYRGYYRENCNGRYLEKNMQKIVCLRSSREHTRQITGLCLSKDKNILFSSSGKIIRLWNTYTMECMGIWQCRSIVGCMTINSGYLFVGFAGLLKHNIIAWGIDKWREIGIGRGNTIDRRPRKLEGHRRIIKCLDSVGSWVVSGSVDKTIKVWDANHFLCLRTIFTKGYIVNVKIAEEKIISLVDDEGEERYLKIWDFATGDHLHNVKIGGWCNTFAYEQETKTFLMGSTELSYYTIEMLMKEDCILTDCDTISAEGVKITSLYMTKQFDIVASSWGDIHMIPREASEFFSFSFTGCDDIVVAICGSGNMIFSGSQNGRIQFWGIPSRREKQE
jgi:WD40 repeat protein